MGYARTKLEEVNERVKELEDQLGDWNATFPNRTASDAIALLQQANTERDALKAKLEAAKRACGEMREALIPFQCETCGGTHLFTFECQGCLTGEAECTCDKQQPEPCPQCQSDNGSKEMYAKLERAISSTCGTGYVKMAIPDAYVTTTDTCSHCHSKLRNAETSRLAWQGEAYKLSKENEQLRAKLEAAQADGAPVPWPPIPEDFRTCSEVKSPAEYEAVKSDLWDIINRRTEERDKANLKAITLKAKLEAAKRACGEMREALELARHKFITQHAIDLDQLNSMPTPFDNALSSTCGSGYKSPTEYEALQKENEQLRKALKPTIELIERCVVHYYDPMNERYHLQKELTRLSALVKEPQSLAK